MATTAPPRTVEALERLRDALAGARLGLDLPTSRDGEQARDELAAQIDDYLLPRLRTMEAPLLMVVGGSTGAGKSTLVNSLLGAEVSPAGVLRPTTRAPVLAHHPGDGRWFADDRILPGLPRATGGEAGAGVLVLVPTEALPEGLALLDAPDIDSVAAENRALAAQLLAAADAWLFVTTAARYADAVPWELLQAARERGTALALVLDRVPDGAAGEVTAHLREMLAERGLGGTEILVVPESTLDDGLLPAPALAPVRAWLDRLAADAHARTALIERTLSGALASVGPRAATVATAVEAEAAASARLRTEASAAYARACEEFEEALRSGTLLRGEVLARWHEVIGTGDFMRALETRVAWARDRIRSAVTGHPAADAEVRAAVETSVESLVRAAAERAAERAARAWGDDAAGRTLLAQDGGLERPSPGLAERVEREVRDWQRGVFELVRSEAAGKRTTARLASLGVNAAGLTVMLAVFVHTGGLTGAEVVVAGGTSAAAQKMLEAIFGDQAVRELAARAREDLLSRVRALLDGEAARFDDALARHLADADAVAALHEAQAHLARARR
jgi:energy-coupling factor transporter ATP-binding protein EcfA2